jgi:hypothetical protein
MGSPGNTRLLFLVEGMLRQDKKIYMGNFPINVIRRRRRVVGASWVTRGGGEVVDLYTGDTVGGFHGPTSSR